jgi:putative acetyltransferase
MLREWIIRKEKEEDFDFIDAVVTAASGEPELPPLIRQLRSDGHAILGLVADLKSKVVGHIMMCRLSIDTAAPRSIDAVALAPLMVDPKYQNRGIGSDLTRQALSMCRDSGENIVLVLGHPTYYPRFGFSAALVQNLRIPFAVTPGAYMGLELEPGAMTAVKGKVRYPRAFGLTPEWTLPA